MSMNSIELKKELLAAIDASDLRGLLPRFCASARSLFERMDLSDADEATVRSAIAIFRSPDAFIGRAIEQMGDDELIRKLNSLSE